MPRQHAQVAEAGDGRDQVLSDAVAEIVLIGVAAEIVERQDRDRRSLGGTRNRRDQQGGAAAHQPVGPDRAGDVLEPRLAQAREAEAGLAVELVAHRARDDDPAGFGQPLEPGGDIDAVAVEILVRHDHVAEIEADPQRQPGVVARLDRHGAGGGVDHARELREQAVAEKLDQPAAMLGEQRLDHLSAQPREPGQRLGLVPLDEPRIVDHVRRQDRREPPLGARCRHAVSLPG